jgi:hypothetical protein
MTLAADTHLAEQLDDAEPTVHKDKFVRRFELAHEV